MQYICAVQQILFTSAHILFIRKRVNYGSTPLIYFILLIKQNSKYALFVGMENLKTGYSASQVNERLTRINAWINETNNRKDLLEKEIKDKGDIVLLNVKDVYRNIPLKLLKFYKWY